MSGKGQRFLLLAVGRAGSQTCAAEQLKGAALGVRCAPAAGSAARLLPRSALWEGPGRAPPGRGATWPAPHGQARSSGCVPEQRQLQLEGSASLLGGSSSTCVLFPPPPPLAFFFNDFFGCYVPAPVSALLAATGFLPPTRRGTESQVPPQGRALLGISSRDETERAQPVRGSGRAFRRHQPGPHTRTPKVRKSPKPTRQQNGEKKKKKSFANALI